MVKKQYFEFVEGNSAKFWEISIDDVAVTTRYGKIGVAGQSTTKATANSAAAEKLYTQLVAEKSRKGYVELVLKVAAKGKSKSTTTSPNKDEAPISKAKKTALTALTPSKPVLFLGASQWRDVKDEAPELALRLESAFSKSSESSTFTQAKAFAKGVATALAKVCLSSDTDVPYKECVIEGIDLREDKQLYAAFGIEKTEIITDHLLDGDTKKLASYWSYDSHKHKSSKTMYDLMTLNCACPPDEDELEEIEGEEYFSKKEKQAFQAAAKLLDNTQSVISVLLVGSRVCKIGLILGRIEDQTWAGVMTWRIDT